MDIIFCLLKLSLLIYGGVVDWKRREIPNLVPIGLFAVSIAELILKYGSTLGDRLFMLGIVIVWIIIAEIKAAKNKGVPIPGGDIKLLCTLAFSEGLFLFVAALMGVVLIVVAVKLFDRKNKIKSFPLCTYVATTYLAIFSFVFLPTIVQSWNPLFFIL